MTSPVSSVIEHIRSDVPSDGELLGRFVERRDESALAGLVKRHGPMVWGVCRRLLSHHDAEDAFQAAFIILVKKAASVNPRGMVGNWLFGVARQAALQARSAAKRRAREIQAVQMPDTEAAQDQWADVRPILDEELSRLPDHYRAVIVLCDLEGRSRKVASLQLSIPEGSIASRLSRARAMLAKRLTQRGVVCSTLTAVLSQNIGLAVVPPSVVSSTIKAASLCRQAAIPANVAALTEGVLKAMLFTKLKAIVAIAVFLGLLATGATVMMRGNALAEQDDPKTAKAKSVALTTEAKTDNEPLGKIDNESFTAWSEKYPGGVQVGLGYRAGEKRAYSIGETVTLAVRARNVGKKEMLFWYHRQPTEKTPPRVTDNEGRTLLVPQKDKEVEEDGVADVALASGAQIDLYYIRFKLCPAIESRNKGYMTIYGTGKFQIQETGLKGESSLGKFGTGFVLSPMLCGKVELEVKEPEKKPPQNQEKKENLPSWGKDVNGVQIGIQLGEHRVYTIGETVTLILRVRNNGKNEVPFRDDAEYFNKNPPLITDTNNKAVAIKESSIFGFIRTRSVAPGKEVDLIHLLLALRPNTDREKEAAWTLYGTGKFHIQYEAVPVVGEVNLGSPGMTLATGKVELEVKEDR